MTGRLTYEELEQRVLELEAIEVDRRQREQRLQETIEELVKERTAELQQELTRRVKTEESLADSVRHYRLLAESISDIVWTSNMDLRFTYVSPSVKRFIGHDPEELIGQSIVEHLTPASTEAAAKDFLEMLAKGDTESPDTSARSAVELQRFHKDGSKVWGEVGFTILRDKMGRPVEILGVTRDITERKRAEEALAESERRYARAEAIARLGHWDGSPVENRSIWSDQLYHIFGLDPAKTKPTYDEFLKLVHPSDRDRVGGEVKEILSRSGTTEIEYRIVRTDGEERVIRSVVDVTLARNGNLERTFGTLQDISECKRIEQALVKTEEKWRSMTENSPDFILVLDTEGDIQFINRSPYQPKEQVVGSSMLDLTEKKYKPVVKELLERVRRTGQPGCAEALYLNPEGVSRLFEVRVGPVFDAGRVVAFMLNGTDITDRKRMQEEIARAQQLESIGVLAGGIAHDLNNILTPVLANLSTAKMYGKFDDEIAELLTDAERATVRAKGLTQQLLTFARGGEPITKTMQVSKSIRESAKFALSGSSARCEFSLPEGLWLVDADEIQLSQVIQNVVINAEQAMDEGGAIKISAENLILKDDPLVSTQDGKCVRISIEDQGCGIPEKQLSKIFDPFFTTKEKGRGLGLSTSFSIVKRHGGHMKVSSEVGVGTRLDIYLPASKRTSVSEEGERPKLAQGEGRVLLIDDEDTVRRSASMILKRLGFEVEVAGDGQEGITLYRKARDLGRPFCAVVMDLTIPGGMGGKTAIQKLMETDPQAKVIVSSGYSDDPVLSNFRDYGFSGVLKKPYNAEELGMVLLKTISET